MMIISPTRGWVMGDPQRVDGIDADQRAASSSCAAPVSQSSTPSETSIKSGLDHRWTGRAGLAAEPSHIPPTPRSGPSAARHGKDTMFTVRGIEHILRPRLLDLRRVLQKGPARFALRSRTSATTTAHQADPVRPPSTARSPGGSDQAGHFRARALVVRRERVQPQDRTGARLWGQCCQGE
jgi:hypothetical protein